MPSITSVVGVVPSDVVWEGWGRAGPATASFSWEGRPLPFMPYLGMELELARLGRGERAELRRAHAAGRAAHPGREAAAAIAVETFAGEMLVIGGDEDRTWPSGLMARTIAARRSAVGRATALLDWPNAGHALAGPGTEPVAPMLGGGGTANGLAEARRMSWAATIAFLKPTLRAADNSDDKRGRSARPSDEGHGPGSRCRAQEAAARGTGAREDAPCPYARPNPRAPARP